jgi:hypothetical protein
MSHLLCPLCGKSSSLNNFDPSSFDLDIYVRKVKGLGRGRGFTIDSEVSALGDPSIVDPIKERILELAKMLHDNDKISDNDLAEHFGLVPKESLQSLISDIEQALEEDSEDWKDEIEEDEEDDDDDDQDSMTYKTLCFGLERLIDSYGALAADLEEEEEGD